MLCEGGLWTLFVAADRDFCCAIVGQPWDCVLDWPCLMLAPSCVFSCSCCHFQHVSLPNAAFFPTAFMLLCSMFKHRTNLSHISPARMRGCSVSSSACRQGLDCMHAAPCYVSMPVHNVCVRCVHALPCACMSLAELCVFAGVTGLCRFGGANVLHWGALWIGMPGHQWSVAFGGMGASSLLFAASVGSL